MKPPVKWLSWEPYNMLKEVIVNKIESQIAFKRQRQYVAEVRKR